MYLRVYIPLLVMGGISAAGVRSAYDGPRSLEETHRVFAQVRTQTDEKEECTDEAAL